MSINAPVAYAVGNHAFTGAVAIDNAGFGWGANDITDADVAIISCNLDGAVITYDGTTPTTVIGIPIPESNSYRLEDNQNIRALQMAHDDVDVDTVTVTITLLAVMPLRST